MLDFLSPWLCVLLSIPLGVDGLGLRSGGAQTQLDAPGTGPEKASLLSKWHAVLLLEPSKYITLPVFLEHVVLWHVLAGCISLILVVALVAARRRRRLQQEEDANVKSGLALLWALSHKDVSSRLAYFTKRRALETVMRSVDSQQKVSTKEFDETTLTGAAALLRGLVVRGECVLVCLPPSIDFYNAIVSCMRAGVPFVPLSPEVARDERQVRRVIAETKVTAIITTDTLHAEFKRGGGSMMGSKNKKDEGKGLRDLRTITVGDLLRSKDVKEQPRIRSPKGHDVACIFFGGSDTSAPTTTSFSHQNMWCMIDSWLQSGMHSKVIATSFSDHTTTTAISYFLGTVCSGGQFVLPAADTKPSPKALQNLNATHCFVADEMQTVFDWNMPATKAQERAIFVTTPTSTFTDNAMKNSLKARAVYSTPMHIGGISGVATKLVVLRDELVTKGSVKVLSLTARLKAGAKATRQPNTMTFISQGLLQDNVDLLIRSDEACVEDDTVGEIHIRSALQAAGCSGMGPKNMAGFTSTGEYGFVSSKNLHLYIVAGLGDSIMLDKRRICAPALERAIESSSPLTKSAVFAVEGKDNSTKVVIAAEMRNDGVNAKQVIAGLQRFAQAEKLPLGAIMLVKSGTMPLLHGGPLVSRAAAKMNFLQGTLAVAPGGEWAAAAKAAPTVADEAGKGGDENLDDVEVCIFAAGSNREQRKQLITECGVRELQKIGLAVTAKSDEWSLNSNQMAQATKRFTKMLTSQEDDWETRDVSLTRDGEVAPFGQGVFVSKTIQINALLFLDTEGLADSIVDRLEAMKFPSEKSLGKLRKAGPKLAPAKFEGTPMSIGQYRVLEFCGMVFVALILGLAVGGANLIYNFLWRFIPNSAFSFAFPAFLNCFSFLTTISKWTIIGKYKPCALARYTPEFFRWWVMDRLVETWEGWVAVWLSETQFLTGFYAGCGMKVDTSASLSSYMREFDLITIGVEADIAGELLTRIVTRDGVIMHKISVGSGAKVDTKAIVTPGCIIEDGATVEKCEILPAGTVRKAVGEPRSFCRSSGLKLIWAQTVLNLVCGVGFMGKFISPTATAIADSVKVSSFWLYVGANPGLEGPVFMDAMRWVTYYMFFIWGLGLGLTIWCVIAKWLMFGKLKDGHVTGGMWWDLRVYCLTWWWSAAYMLFIQYWVDCTLLSIVLYRCFGANVSLRTGLRFMQNMGPHHADFVTIRDGANMSNAKCHPATPENGKILKNIEIKEGAFIGLMSMVQGGITVGKGAAVATTTCCNKSLKDGDKMLGEKIISAKSEASSDSFDFSQITACQLGQELLVSLLIRTGVNIGFILFLSGAVASCFLAAEILPLPLVIVFAVFSVTFFVGLAYAFVSVKILHPGVETDLQMGSWKAACWLQYLQALFLSQAYTSSLINGSWMAAAVHKLLGADTPLDAQWYGTIRDQCLLKCGHDAVIDKSAYFVGHVGTPSGALKFEKTTIGDRGQLHPHAIVLSGQSLGKNATLDVYSHSHIETVIPEGKFYSGNPACASNEPRVDLIARSIAELPKETK